jgi:tetratricopeptide (TPR) repeat protein
VAQALEYESLLRRPAPGSALSEALQRIADLVPEGEARSRYQALAAVVHALGNEDDATTSHALLSKALQHGSDNDAFARLGRSLAARAGDRKWFLEATQRVLRTARPNERPGLLFDLVRTSLSIGDETAASFNLDEASDTPEGAWVAATLNAYATASPAQDGNSRSERALRALSRLGSLDPDPDRAFAAKHVVQSLRAKAGRSASQRELEELHRERPSDVVLALQLSDRSPDPASSARVLSETADACTDVELSFILHLLAAIHGFRAGVRERAIRDLKQAQTVHPEVVAPLLSWALRSAHPDDIEERRLMLDALRTSGRDPDLYALERFGLEVGSPSQRGEATMALDQAQPDPGSELGQALILARALWPVASGHAEAVAWLEQRGESGREIARALAFLHERRSEDASPERLLASSRRWAETGSLAGGLEWLSVALCQGDWEEEILAREQIAKELGASAAASLRSSSLLIAWLSGRTPDLLAADAPLSQLANLEVAPPGCDPRRRAHALSTAESALSSAAGHTALILAGYNQLFAGAAREALGSFHAALSVVPDDLGAWEGIRAAAEELGNVRLAADALHKLASLTRVPGRAAELERTRADLLGQAGDAEASQRALERAVELDVEHFESFNRLFRRFRGEKRYDKVLELADRRLQVTNDSREVAKLCWERARAYRSLGNMDAALADLDTVRVLDPSHPGPAALAGEIYVTLGDMDKAADELSKLAAMESAPADQRLMSGIAAADLFDGKLNQPARAVHVLESLHSAGLGTLATTERLAKSLARVERWEDAVHQLESLMHRREDQEGRMQAARLCLVICRDELQTPARAFAACEKLLGDAPADAEALDYLLLGGLRTERSLELVRIGRESILARPATRFDLDTVTRLSRIAERLSDRDLLLSTLGLLACTEATSRRIVEDADALLLHTARWPARNLTDEDVRTLFADALDDPVGELCVLLAPYVPLVMPPNTKTLGLGRRDRLRSNAAPELFEELHGWLDATGNGSAEVYAGGVHDQILLLPTEKAPTLVLGPELRAPLTREQQATLARRCIGVRAGLSSVDERPAQEVVAVITAACALGEVEIPGARPVPDLVKALGKELPRRVRKLLPDIGGRIRATGVDPHDWTARALGGLDRAEALALGDVSRMLLGEDERARGETVTGHFNEAQERRLNELSAFITSTAWRSLRERLGLAHP